MFLYKHPSELTNGLPASTMTYTVLTHSRCDANAHASRWVWQGNARGLRWKLSTSFWYKLTFGETPEMWGWHFEKFLWVFWYFSLSPQWKLVSNTNLSWTPPPFSVKDTTTKLYSHCSSLQGMCAHTPKIGFWDKTVSHLTDKTWNIQGETNAASSLSPWAGIRELWPRVKQQQRQNLVSLSAVVWNLSLRTSEDTM